MSRLISSLERPALDFKHFHFRHEKHGMVVWGMWWLDLDQNKYQPALVLTHAGRPLVPGKTMPCIVPLDECWRWAAHGDVGDPAGVAKTVVEWLSAGYLPGNVHSARDRVNVLDAVNSYLPDLINMPPKPRFAQRVVGEAATIDHQTGRIIDEKELRLDV